MYTNEVHENFIFFKWDCYTQSRSMTCFLLEMGKEVETTKVVKTTSSCISSPQ
jgi:hypothetical protein